MDSSWTNKRCGHFFGDRQLDLCLVINATFSGDFGRFGFCVCLESPKLKNRSWCDPGISHADGKPA